MSEQYDVTPEMAGILGMYDEKTYAIDLRKNDARDKLELYKFIEWMPPKFGGNNSYGITDLGKEWKKHHGSTQS